jgi:hypothetical protein
MLNRVVHLVTTDLKGFIISLITTEHEGKATYIYWPIDCRQILFYENMYGCKVAQLLCHWRNNIALNQDATKRKLGGTNPFIHRCYVTVTNKCMEQSWESDTSSSLLWNQHYITALVDACLWVLSRRKSEHLKTLCSIIRYILILSSHLLRL